MEVTQDLLDDCIVDVTEVLNDRIRHMSKGYPVIKQFSGYKWYYDSKHYEFEPSEVDRAFIDVALEEGFALAEIILTIGPVNLTNEYFNAELNKFYGWFESGWYARKEIE